MLRLSRGSALNLVAGSLGLYAFTRVVFWPASQLFRYGLRPHGSAAEDPEFYFGLEAHLLLYGGAYLALALCLLGMSLALGTGLGFRVRPRARARARRVFWIAPLLALCGELLGRYLLQAWWAQRGLFFPSFSFIHATLPHLAWWAATWLLLAPAILTGRGLYLVRWRDWAARGRGDDLG